MTFLTYLNSHPIIYVISAFVIILVIILLKNRKKKEPDYSKFNQRKSILNNLINQDFNDEPIRKKILEESNLIKDNKSLFNQLEKEREDYEKLNERLKNIHHSENFGRFHKGGEPSGKSFQNSLPKDNPSKPSKFWKVFWIILAISILIGVIFLAWGIRNDKFKSSVNQSSSCPEINITTSCPACPSISIPSCPSCPDNNQTINLKCDCNSS